MILFIFLLSHVFISINIPRLQLRLPSRALYVLEAVLSHPIEVFFVHSMAMALLIDSIPFLMGVYAASGFHLSLLLQANHSEHPHSWFLPHFLSTDKRPAPWSLASGSEDLNILIWIDSAPKVGPTYSFSSRSVVSLTSASL